MRSFLSKLPTPFFEENNSTIVPNNKTEEEIETMIKEMEALIEENNRIEEEFEKDELDFK